MPSNRASESPWTPILNGALREKACQAIRDICDALSPDAFSVTGESPDLLAHYALFHAYLEAGLPEDSSGVAGKLIEAAVHNLAQAPMHPWLHGGFTHVAWVVDHLQRFADPDSESQVDADDANAFDQELLQHVNRPSWVDSDSKDLITGLVGFGVYALERLPRSVARQCLEHILRHLSAQATWVGEDATWWTPPDLIALSLRDRRKKGEYDLGVAHGVAGMIGLLGELCGTSAFTEQSQRLLSAAIRWLLKRKLPDGSGSWFPDVVAEGNEPQPARSAWCYGDPGIAVTLLLAARHCPQSNLEETALRIASAAARREAATCGVVDAGLCHGAAGLGHLYNRIYQATRDDLFLTAARFWFEKTLELRKVGTGVAGFSGVHGPGVTDHFYNHTFLSGAGGIGLGLLAAISSIEPRWDRLLLASVPPKPI